MTTEEYLETPESLLPHELAYGVLRVADSPSISHQRAVLNISMALVAFVQERQIGEVILSPMDVILDFDADLVVQPDILYVSTSRSTIVRDKVYGAPDLVIEVLSPTTRIGKLEEHTAWFAQYGVRESWVVHLPERRIEVLTFAGGAVARRRSFHTFETVVSNVLEGLTLQPADVLGVY